MNDRELNEESLRELKERREIYKNLIKCHQEHVDQCNK